jgi:hypothetical protein
VDSVSSHEKKKIKKQKKERRNKHISAATNKHATVEVLEAVLSVSSTPRLHNEDQREDGCLTPR